MEATQRFPRDVRSPAQARRWARSSLAPVCTDAALDGALVVLSELVTNAVRHGHGDVLVTVRAGTREVAIDVHDDNSGDVTPRDPGPWDLGGRGLHLVEGLSKSWGVEHHADNGKTVWARLACSVSDDA